MRSPIEKISLINNKLLGKKTFDFGVPQHLDARGIEEERFHDPVNLLKNDRLRKYLLADATPNLQQ